MLTGDVFRLLPRPFVQDGFSWDAVAGCGPVRGRKRAVDPRQGRRCGDAGPDSGADPLGISAANWADCAQKTVQKVRDPYFALPQAPAADG